MKGPLRDSGGKKCILAIGAHTDDIELGCGGSIARAIHSGYSVHYLIFSIARASVPKGFPEDTLAKEALEAAERIGVDTRSCSIHDFPVRKLSSCRQEILEILVKCRASNWNAVLCPSPTDIHQDHSTVGYECLRAFKGNSLLLSYELPWNQIGHGEELNAFAVLSENEIKTKVDALSCFKTQSIKGRGYMEPEFVASWARLRGAQAGAEYAEAFRVWRWRI